MKELIPSLPKRDVRLAKKFLEERDFMEMFELVESGIQKLNKKALKTGSLTDNQIAELTELRDVITDYMADIDVSYGLDSYDYY